MNWRGLCTEVLRNGRFSRQVYYDTMPALILMTSGGLLPASLRPAERHIVRSRSTQGVRTDPGFVGEHHLRRSVGCYGAIDSRVTGFRHDQQLIATNCLTLAGQGSEAKPGSSEAHQFSLLMIRTWAAGIPGGPFSSILPEVKLGIRILKGPWKGQRSLRLG